jgi:hypothetical protein
VSPWEVIDLFKAALEQPGWTNDKMLDQFPRARGKDGSGIPPPGSDNGANHGDPNQGKKRGFTKSLGVDVEQAPAKRQRADELLN